MLDTIYDFSDCFLFPVNDYGGAETKERIRFHDENYLIKFRKFSAKNNDMASNYTNNIFSEYICCHIIETLNVPVQKTLLGVYKEEYVVACKDFTPTGMHSSEFADLSNSFISESKLKPHPELDFVLKCYEERFQADADHPFRKAFWDMFIIDALLGNFDRHAGNWGFLVDNVTGEVIPSPIYDCGSCLYPGVGEHGIDKILTNPSELDMRIYNFPASSIMCNGKKISYFEFISSLENEECNAALFRIFPKISLEKINNVIDNTPLISDKRKRFYKFMISYRFEKILSFSFEKALKVGLIQDKDNDFQDLKSIIASCEEISKNKTVGRDGENDNGTRKGKEFER